MNGSSGCWMAVGAVCAVLLTAQDANAYRMIQNSSTGRTSFGTQVTCDAAGGFAHRTSATIQFRLNPANQGGKAGVAAALQNSLAAWTNVSPAAYQLTYGGTTNAGFQTDGINTVMWASGNGCTGGCLAITALVLGPGQEIQEADVSFNNDFNWNTNGSDYDVQAIAAHELGHCMGIHHTEITQKHNRPTMYATYFGLDGRTLEADDQNALNCAYSRYPPTGATPAITAGDDPPPGEPGVELVPRLRAGHTSLRFALDRSEDVRLEVFDIAGRRVATLLDGVRGAGEHEVAWDGEARAGAVQRGVYFARLVTQEGHSSTTIVVGL